MEADRYGRTLQRRMQWVWWLLGFCEKPLPRPTYRRTDDVLTAAELRHFIVLDDDEDADDVLRPGVFQTCAGEWRREQDGRWRWWQDVEWNEP